MDKEDKFWLYVSNVIFFSSALGGLVGAYLFFYYGAIWLATSFVTPGPGLGMLLNKLVAGPNGGQPIIGEAYTIAANEMSFQMAVTGLFIMLAWAILYILWQIRDAVEGRE